MAKISSKIKANLSHIPYSLMQCQAVCLVPTSCLWLPSVSSMVLTSWHMLTWHRSTSNWASEHKQPTTVTKQLSLQPCKEDCNVDQLASTKHFYNFYQHFCFRKIWFWLITMSIKHKQCFSNHDTTPLTHRGRDKMGDVFQTTCLNAFSWMKIYKLRLRFHWSLFPSVQLTILAMPRVETRGSENEEESKQRCVTYEFIVWIISTSHPPLPSHRSRRVLTVPLTRVDLNIMRP